MRVLFWGTPDFAAPPLRALIGEGHDVVGVVTQPDRAQGRHRSVPQPPPVKEIALDVTHSLDRVERRLDALITGAAADRRTAEANARVNHGE